MPIDEKTALVQSTALFYTAAELSRRDFNVSIADKDVLLCCKDGKEFYVKVSGQKFKKSWIIEIEKNFQVSFYIYVYIPKKISECPEFFILSEKELLKEIKRKKLKSPEEFLKEGVVALSYSVINKYSDRWFSLSVV